jgi:hypothetical protein
MIDVVGYAKSLLDYPGDPRAGPEVSGEAFFPCSFQEDPDEFFSFLRGQLRWSAAGSSRCNRIEPPPRDRLLSNDGRCVGRR